MSEFSVLAPFGRNNPKPVFADKNLRVSRMWVVGKNNNVLRLFFDILIWHANQCNYFGDIESFLTISGKGLVRTRLRLHKEEGSII